MPEGVASFDFGMKTVGSRMPSHDDQSLCRFEHFREQVWVAHRGQVYLGGSM
jgi:hypothetical protein